MDSLNGTDVTFLENKLGLPFSRVALTDRIKTVSEAVQLLYDKNDVADIFNEAMKKKLDRRFTDYQESIKVELAEKQKVEVIPNLFMDTIVSNEQQNHMSTTIPTKLSLSKNPRPSSPHRGSVGLFNLTNTCYMSATLIALLYCKPISRTLLCDAVRAGVSVTAAGRGRILQEIRSAPSHRR